MIVEITGEQEFLNHVFQGVIHWNIFQLMIHYDEAKKLEDTSKRGQLHIVTELW